MGIQTFLIVCPLVFLAGFVDAIAGGGGLISLPAYMFAGVPVHNAIATNKLSSCTGTVVSTWRLIKNKRVETQKYENKSDDNVNNYNYNYYIYNDGTLEELKDWAKWFLLKIGVELNDKVY